MNQGVLGGRRFSGGGPVFYDTFTDTDGTLLTAHTPDIGGAWVNGLGTWKINDSNQAVSLSYSGVTAIVVTDTGLADCTISCDIIYAASAGMRIVYRFVDSNNYWLAYWSGTSLILYEMTAGVLSNRANTTTVDSGIVTMTVTLAGDDHTLNHGTSELTYTSAVRNAATKHGISDDSNLGAAKYDNFTVDP